MSQSRELEEARVFRRNVIILSSIVGTVFVALAVLMSQAPRPDQPECKNVGLTSFARIVMPSAIGGFSDKMSKIRELWLCAEAYGAENPGFTLTAYASVYVTLQSFALPGSLALSVLAGALYPVIKAQVLVDLCATVGASTCYLLSYCFGRGVVNRLMPGTMDSFKRQIDAHNDNLMYYMMFIRLTPLIPNAFVNMASSVVGMPFSIFFIGTILGLIPATFIHVSTGRALRNATVVEGNTIKQMVILFSLQFLALLPLVFKKRLQKAEERKLAVQEQAKKD